LRRKHTTTVDDIDGGPADETVTFACDGATYEIDLSRANAIRLRSTLQPFVSAARRVGGTPTHRPTAQHRPAAIPTRRDPEQTKAIRAWANANDHKVSPRGKISDAVAAAYEAAH
jgi:hypothetical protein